MPTYEFYIPLLFLIFGLFLYIFGIISAENDVDVYTIIPSKDKKIK